MPIFTILSIGAILTILAICPILSVGTIVDSNRPTLCKQDSVTNQFITLINRCNRGDIIVILQCLNDFLHRFDIGVKFVT